MTKHVEVMELVARLKAAEETFVLATVVRTVSVTAAKAGAKAIIRPDGTIVAGWIGGGGARAGGVTGPRGAAKGLGAPGESSGRTRRKARRDPRRRPLRREYVPEQGHHGRVRRAG